MRMTISNDMIGQITKFEGIRLKAYLDVGGIPTIGIGHTGNDVLMGDQISLDEAYRLFRNDIYRFETSVNRLNDKLVASRGIHGGLTQQQFDALVSLIYNTGEGAISNTSTFFKVLMNGGRSDYLKICHAFMLWVKVRNAKTRQLEVCGGKDGKHGLVLRRASEAAWYVYGPNWEQITKEHGITDIVEWARS